MTIVKEAKPGTIATDTKMHFCSGCTHTTIHQQLIKVIDEMGIADQVTAIAPVGCSSYLMKYLSGDVLAGPHGRGPAMAAAIKQLTDRIVFTYQGDGDMAAIGTAEIFHAAVRGDNFTVIYVNNATYGMTTGQSSPTSIIGQVSRTDKNGRDSGHPFDICSLLAKMPGVRYVERTSCNTKENIEITKKAIRKAFENQMNFSSGLNVVEVMAICPPGFKKDVSASNEWMVDELLSVYETGVLHQYETGVLTEEE